MVVFHIYHKGQEYEVNAPSNFGQFTRALGRDIPHAENLVLETMEGHVVDECHYKVLVASNKLHIHVREKGDDTPIEISSVPHPDTMLKAGGSEWHGGPETIPFAICELVDNALQYVMPYPVRQIKIHLVKRRGKTVAISIWDSGSGMDYETLKNWAVLAFSGEAKGKDLSQTPERDVLKHLDGQIGFHGVGSKHAVFFLGNRLHVRTRPDNGTKVLETELSGDEMRDRFNNNDRASAYNHHQRSIAPGDASTLTAGEALPEILKLVEAEPKTKHFTHFIITDIRTTAVQNYPEHRLKKHLAHIYHYYVHGWQGTPHGNPNHRGPPNKPPAERIKWNMPDTMKGAPDAAGPVIDILVNDVSLSSVTDDLESQYLSLSKAKYDFAYECNGGRIYGVINYFPFEDGETIPGHDDTEVLTRPWKEAVFECFWHGRLIPSAFVKSLPFMDVVGGRERLPKVVLKRIAGSIFFGNPFKVTRNKMAFQEDVNEQLKNLNFGRSDKEAFRKWITEAHETQDDEEKYVFGTEQKDPRDPSHVYYTAITKSFTNRRGVRKAVEIKAGDIVCFAKSRGTIPRENAIPTHGRIVRFEGSNRKPKEVFFNPVRLAAAGGRPGGDDLCSPETDVLSVSQIHSVLTSAQVAELQENLQRNKPTTIEFAADHPLKPVSAGRKADLVFHVRDGEGKIITKLADGNHKLLVQLQIIDSEGKVVIETSNKKPLTAKDGHGHAHKYWFRNPAPQQCGTYKIKAYVDSFPNCILEVDWTISPNDVNNVFPVRDTKTTPLECRLGVPSTDSLVIKFRDKYKNPVVDGHVAKRNVTCKLEPVTEGYQPLRSHVHKYKCVRGEFDLRDVVITTDEEYHSPIEVIEGETVKFKLTVHYIFTSENEQKKESTMITHLYLRVFPGPIAHFKVVENPFGRGERLPPECSLENLTQLSDLVLNFQDRYGSVSALRAKTSDNESVKVILKTNILSHAKLTRDTTLTPGKKKRGVPVWKSWTKTVLPVTGSISFEGLKVDAPRGTTEGMVKIDLVVSSDNPDKMTNQEVRVRILPSSRPAEVLIRPQQRVSEVQSEGIMTFQAPADSVIADWVLEVLDESGKKIDNPTGTITINGTKVKLGPQGTFKYKATFARSVGDETTFGVQTDLYARPDQAEGANIETSFVLSPIALEPVRYALVDPKSRKEATRALSVTSGVLMPGPVFVRVVDKFGNPPTELSRFGRSIAHTPRVTFSEGLSCIDYKIVPSKEIGMHFELRDILIAGPAGALQISLAIDSQSPLFPPTQHPVKLASAVPSKISVRVKVAGPERVMSRQERHALNAASQPEPHDSDLAIGTIASFSEIEVFLVGKYGEAVTSMPATTLQTELSKGLTASAIEKFRTVRTEKDASAMVAFPNVVLNAVEPGRYYITFQVKVKGERHRDPSRILTHRLLLNCLSCNRVLGLTFRGEPTLNKPVNARLDSIEVEVLTEDKAALPDDIKLDSFELSIHDKDSHRVIQGGHATSYKHPLVRFDNVNAPDRADAYEIRVVYREQRPDVTEKSISLTNELTVTSQKNLALTTVALDATRIELRDQEVDTALVSSQEGRDIIENVTIQCTDKFGNKAGGVNTIVHCRVQSTEPPNPTARTNSEPLLLESSGPFKLVDGLCKIDRITVKQGCKAAGGTYDLIFAAPNLTDIRFPFKFTNERTETQMLAKVKQKLGALRGERDTIRNQLEELKESISVSKVRITNLNKKLQPFLVKLGLHRIEKLEMKVVTDTKDQILAREAEIRAKYREERPVLPSSSTDAVRIARTLAEKFEGCLGLVSDLVTVSPHTDAAVALVLGRYIGGDLVTLVVEDEKTYQDIRTHCLREGITIPRVMPLSFVQPYRGEVRPGPQGLLALDSVVPMKDFVGFAANLVTLRASNVALRRTLVWTLFKKLLVFSNFESLKNARLEHIRKKLPGAFNGVELSGRSMSGRGTIDEARHNLRLGTLPLAHNPVLNDINMRKELCKNIEQILQVKIAESVRHTRLMESLNSLNEDLKEKSAQSRRIGGEGNIYIAPPYRRTGGTRPTINGPPNHSNQNGNRASGSGNNHRGRGPYNGSDHHAPPKRRRFK